MSANSSFEATRFWETEEAKKLLDAYIKLKVDDVPNRLEWLHREILKKTGLNFHNSTLLRHLRLRKIELYGLPHSCARPKKKRKAAEELDNESTCDDSLADEQNINKAFGISDYLDASNGDTGRELLGLSVDHNVMNFDDPLEEDGLDLESAKAGFSHLLDRVRGSSRKEFFRWVKDLMDTEDAKAEFAKMMDRVVGVHRAELIEWIGQMYGAKEQKDEEAVSPQEDTTAPNAQREGGVWTLEDENNHAMQSQNTFINSPLIFGTVSFVFFSSVSITFLRQLGTNATGRDKLKTNLDEFLSRHLNFADDRLSYDAEEVLALIAQAKTVFKDESTLVDVPLPVAIVGDIHGQYSDLHRIFSVFGMKNPELPGSLSQRYLFLGDYIDRGNCSLEVICCLLVHKIYYPKLFYLIRGNHEHPSVNRSYGFYEEIATRFPTPECEQLYNAFNDLFAYLPLAALVGGRILCMHGGISSEAKSLDDIRKIKRPLYEPYLSEVACDLLWADPMLDLSGFVPNPMRGISVFFGEDALEKMCEQLKVDMVIRGHQVMQNGIGFYCGRKLITLFSAPRYYPERVSYFPLTAYLTVSLKNNKGAILNITKDGRIGIVMLSPTSKLLRGLSKFRETFERQEADTSYTERTFSAESLTLPDSEGITRCASLAAGKAGVPNAQSPMKKLMSPKLVSRKPLKIVPSSGAASKRASTARDPGAHAAKDSLMLPNYDNTQKELLSCTEA
uniref:Serine/threonine-protein phosphatase n=1 Tax=Steinernema glaseri TaxID=37863 RepID=A0A1I8ALW1_9BILA